MHIKKMRPSGSLRAIAFSLVLLILFWTRIGDVIIGLHKEYGHRHWEALLVFIFLQISVGYLCGSITYTHRDKTGADAALAAVWAIACIAAFLILGSFSQIPGGFITVSQTAAVAWGGCFAGICVGRFITTIFDAHICKPI